ncbi:hypothetical protein [Chitinophaga solisilvae]|uniref:hypothetical protein n=1 Tax=Chitinophaga solisilvae TaxID=1233460 RepID=UPI00136B4810|nr:hypothetical protein [Chitinophaga solisilvae]
MIFLSAQPDDIIFLWQLEIQLLNFREMGIDPAGIHVLLAVNPHSGLRPEYRSLVNRQDLACFFIYPDNRTQRRYPSGVRPHIIKQHFLRHTWLKDTAIFYHDCDIIFRELPDFSQLIPGNTWYVSDTRTYLNADYICQHGPQVLKDMCRIADIPPRTVINANDNTGGAQYVLKNTDYHFWDKVETDSENLYTWLKDNQEDYAASWAVNTGNNINDYTPIQHWCADMWAVMWNGLRSGHPISIHPELDFCWPSDNIARWHQCRIYHNAGILRDQRRKYFCKFVYNITFPYYEQLDYLDQDSCSAMYAAAIRRYTQHARIPLRDTTILIPVRIDSADKLANLYTILQFIDKYFETTVIVSEMDREQIIDPVSLPGNVQYHYLHSDTDPYYRTYHHNTLLQLCETPYGALYDADVILAPNQLAWAAEHLRAGATLVYPYDGTEHYVNRNFSNIFRRQPDFGMLHHYQQCFDTVSSESFGGVCLINMSAFRKLGLENINLVGPGHEHKERYKRFRIAGEKIKRTEGVLFHLYHPGRNKPCFHNEKLMLHNRQEYLKVCNMQPAELFGYIEKMKTAAHRPAALQPV